MVHIWDLFYIRPIFYLKVLQKQTYKWVFISVCLPVRIAHGDNRLVDGWVHGVGKAAVDWDMVTTIGCFSPLLSKFLFSPPFGASVWEPHLQPHTHTTIRPQLNLCPPIAKCALWYELRLIFVINGVFSSCLWF